MNTKKNINKWQATNNANPKKGWTTPEVVDLDIEDTEHMAIGAVTDGVPGFFTAS